MKKEIMRIINFLNESDQDKYATAEKEQNYCQITLWGIMLTRFFMADQTHLFN